MVHIGHINRIFFYIFLLLVLVGCSKQKLVTTWKNETLPTFKLDDVLVIGLENHLTTRKIFENVYVEDLMAEKINASASHRISEKTPEPTREALMAVISKSKAKSVLITRITKTKKKLDYQRALENDYSTYDDPYGIFFVTRSPQTTATKVYLYLESNLYDVATERRIWSATVESKDPVMTKKYMRDITRYFIKDLHRQGLL